MSPDLLSFDHPLTRLVVGLLCVFAFVGLNGLVLVWVEQIGRASCRERV